MVRSNTHTRPRKTTVLSLSLRAQLIYPQHTAHIYSMGLFHSTVSYTRQVPTRPNGTERWGLEQCLLLIGYIHCTHTHIIYIYIYVCVTQHDTHTNTKKYTDKKTNKHQISLVFEFCLSCKKHFSKPVPEQNNSTVQQRSSKHFQFLIIWSRILCF